MITVFKSTKTRCNPNAAYVDEEGTQYTQVPPELYEELPEPPMPEDYSEDTYYRVESDFAPYVSYTRKSEEQIIQQYNQKIWKQIAGIEQQYLFPRQLREFLLSQPDAEKAYWYKKIKDVDDEVNTLRGRLK